MKGRKPTPSVIAELHGWPSKGRAKPVDEPVPIGNLDAPPEWLSAEQKANWVYAVSHSAPGLLTTVDRGILVAWVVAEDLHRQATVGQQKFGKLAVKTSVAGVMMQSPYLPIINRQAMIMKAMSTELGFSPAARPRLHVEPGANVPTSRIAGSRQVPATQSLASFLAEGDALN